MKKKLFFVLCAVFLFAAQSWGQIYNPGDIDVINAIIDSKGLNITKANPADGSFVPDDWLGFEGFAVIWSDNVNDKRIIRLYINNIGLEGALDVSGLTQLQLLSCDNSQTSILDVSNLKQLQTLSCSNNQLSTLNVSNLTQLSYLDCSNNHLTALDLIVFNSLSAFYGTGQTRSITLSGSASNYTANVTFGIGASFDNSVLSYSNGMLISTSNAATTSGFISPTGLSEKELTGTLTLSYSEEPGDGGLQTWYLTPTMTATLDNAGVLTISTTKSEGEAMPDNYQPWASSRDKFRSLVIKDGVTTIGNYAFYNCSSFNGNLVIPNSVTTIGDYAFFNCSGFNGNLIIGNSVTTIGDYAFGWCRGFTGNLVIPNSVVTFGTAFYYCNGFNGDLIIGNSVTTIGNNAFAYCSSFAGNLFIGNSVTTIGDYAFINCSGFSGNLVIPNSVVTIGASAFAWCRGFSGNLVIPNSVVTIGASAFSCCYGLNGDLNIPNSVTNIGDNAFNSCVGFTGNLIIGNSVTAVGDNAFHNCRGFTGNLILGNSIINIGVDAFSDCRELTGNLIIPNSVTNIGDNAFANCYKLGGSLTIPNSVTKIGKGVFDSCFGLTNITVNWMTPLSIPDNIFNDVYLSCSNLHVPAGTRLLYEADPFWGTIGTIDDGTTTLKNFWYLSPTMTASLDDKGTLTISTSKKEGETMPLFCNNAGPRWYSEKNKIFSIIIKDGVTTISNYTFMYCSNAISVTIPNSVTSIGACAFAYCSNLLNVFVEWTIPLFVQSNLFQATNVYAATLHVPTDTKDTYRGYPVWRDFGTIVEEGNVFVATLSPSKISAVLKPGGETVFIPVTANIDWTFTNSADWLTVERKIVGEDTGLEITAKVNGPDERKANITLSGTGLFSSVTSAITVYQGHAEITFDPVVLTFAPNETVKTFTVTSNLPSKILWTDNQMPAWIESITPSGIIPEGYTTVTVTVKPATAEQHSALVTFFTSDEYMPKMLISQEATTPKEPTESLTFEAEGGNRDATIVPASGNVTWYINDVIDYSTQNTADWIEVDKSFYKGTQTLNVKALKNPNNTDRKASIFVLNGIDDSLLKEIVVTQHRNTDISNGKLTIQGLTLDADNAYNIDFDFDPVESKTYNITSTVDWKIDYNYIPDWLGVNKLVGKGGETVSFKVSAEAQTVNSPRDAAILFLDMGGTPLAHLHIYQYANTEFEMKSATSGTLVKYHGSGGEIIIPSFITDIDNRVFMNNRLVSGVSFERCSLLNCIGAEAFSGTALTSITIPGSVTEIGFKAFYNCVNLEEYKVDLKNKTYISFDGALYYNNNNGTFGLIHVPYGWRKNKSSFAFANNTSNIVYVTEIGEYAIENMDYRLLTLYIPGSVKSIAINAFIDCRSLTRVMVEWDSYNEIMPFYNSNNVFANQVFNEGVVKSATLQVPKGTKDKVYKKAMVWKDFYDHTVEEPSNTIVGATSSTSGNSGIIALSFNTPVSEQMSGSFLAVNSPGVVLVPEESSLSDDLKNTHDLSMNQESENTWNIQIEPKDIALRAASETVYRNVVNLAYRLTNPYSDENEVEFRDIFFIGDSTVIKQDTLNVVLDSPTKIGEINKNNIVCYIKKDLLVIKSGTQERINVYSEAGILLYQFDKPAGAVNYPVNQPKGAILIVKGSSGWVKKVVVSD